jgi:hypothetical protein
MTDLNVGRVIRGVFEIYRRRAVMLLTCAASIALVVDALDALARSLSRTASLLSVPTDAVGIALLTGIAAALVAETKEGESEVAVGRLLRRVKPRLGQLALVSLAAGVMQAIGVVVLVIPGLYLLTIWAVYAPVVLLEPRPGLEALDRSRELVRGNAWRVFVVVLLCVVSVPALGLALAFADRPAAALARLALTIAFSSVVLPIAALASAVLYFELREL